MEKEEIKKETPEVRLLTQRIIEKSEIEKSKITVEMLENERKEYYKTVITRYFRS